jgi:hypothetical protein
MPRHCGSSLRQSSRARCASSSHRYTSIASGLQPRRARTGAHTRDCPLVRSGEQVTTSDTASTATRGQSKRFNVSTPVFRLPCRSSASADASRGRVLPAKSGLRKCVDRYSGRGRSRLDGRADARRVTERPQSVVFVPSSPRGSRPLFTVIPLRGVHARGTLPTSVVVTKRTVGLCRFARGERGDHHWGCVGGAGALFVSASCSASRSFCCSAETETVLGNLGTRAGRPLPGKAVSRYRDDLARGSKK